MQQLQTGMTSSLKACLLANQPEDALHEGLFEYFASFALKEYANHPTFKAYRCGGTPGCTVLRRSAPAHCKAAPAAACMASHSASLAQAQHLACNACLIMWDCKLSGPTGCYGTLLFCSLCTETCPCCCQHGLRLSQACPSAECGLPRPACLHHVGTGPTAAEAL